MESTDSHDSTTVEKKRVPMNKEHELKSDGHVNTTSDSDSHAFDSIPQLSGKYDALRQNKSLVIKQTEIIVRPTKNGTSKQFCLSVLLCVVTVTG